MSTEENKQPPSRYMSFTEVAHELGVTRNDIRNKVYAGHLVGVDIGTKGSRLRVTRESFEAYCERIEREALARFGAGAA